MVRRHRNYKCWITALGEAQDDNPSPIIFRRWAGISAVAGALGRRVWLDNNAYRVHPNLYITLVAEPGRNKSVSLILPFDKVMTGLVLPLGIKGVTLDEKLLDIRKYSTTNLRLITDRITPEKLISDMKDIQGEDPDLSPSLSDPYYEAAVTMVTSEFGLFLSRNDATLQMFMTDAWDAKREVSYRTKTSGTFLIQGPCLNWIACATPDQFIDNLPENARSQGLLSRIIVVNYDGPKSRILNKYKEIPKQEIEWLRDDLGQIAEIKGEYQFEQGLHEVIQEWYDGGMEPVPISTNMEEYNNRRQSHILKVLLCVAASRRNERVITREDWETAKEWLFDAEKYMPDVLDRFGISRLGRFAESVSRIVRMHYQAHGDGVDPEDLLKRATRIADNATDVKNTLAILQKADIIREGISDKLSRPVFFPGDVRL